MHVISSRTFTGHSHNGRNTPEIYPVWQGRRQGDVARRTVRERKLIAMTKVLGISFGTKNGNNDSICKEALMGAAERGCEVEFIRAMDLDIKHCTGCITCVKMLMSGRGNMCIHKDDFDWLFFKMAEADGIVICDPIFETGASGLFHTIMDRFGPRMDTGNNVISTQIAQKIIAEGGKAKLPDPRIICPGKPISYIGIGGSDYAIQAMTPTWRVIDNEWVPWSKRALLDDEVVARAHQIGTNMANAAKDPEHAAYQGEDGTCPHCHANDYYLVPDTDKAICSVCGLEGHVTLEGGVVKVVYLDEETHDERGLFRAHDTAEGKQIHGEDIGRMEGELSQLQKGDEYKRRVARYKAFVSASMPVRA